MKALIAWLAGYWRVLRRPSVHFSLGFLTLGGFIAGIVFWGGFNTALGRPTPRPSAFPATRCATTCSSNSGHHPLQQPFRSPRHLSRLPRATQVDRQDRAQDAGLKEVWGKIFGTINTREKFLDHRRELAEHEWARLKANDSLECRNCHNFEFMDFTRQSVRARQMHSTALASGEATCIDCHKGIAHHLPDMTGVKGW